MSDLTPDTHFHPLFKDYHVKEGFEFWAMAVENKTPTIHYQRGLIETAIDTEKQLQLLIDFVYNNPLGSLPEEENAAIGNSLWYAQQFSHQYPEKLATFQQNHPNEVRPESIAPVLTQCEEIRMGNQLYSYLPLIRYKPPTRLLDTYVHDVLQPVFDHDHYLQSSLLKWSNEHTDHEAFHLGTIKHGNPDISQPEWIEILRTLLPYDREICNTERNIQYLNDPHDTHVRFSHQCHEDLANMIKRPDLRRRFKMNARIRGIQEDWARAFTRAMGGEGEYSGQGLDYMTDLTTYFAGGEPEIARITNRLQTEGIEHTAEIYQQELKTKLSL